MRQLVRVVSLVTAAVALQGCVVKRVVTMPASPPAESTEALPPGTVELNVIPEENTETWDVIVGNRVACQTPCKQRVSAGTELLLRGPGGDEALAPRLSEVDARAQRALLVAEGTQEGKRVNGIVFTTLGGMALVTAITLTAVGCSDTAKHGGMCTAGLITGGVAVPLTAAALWMLIDSGARVHVLPVASLGGGPGAAPARVAVVPTGLAGTF